MLMFGTVQREDEVDHDQEPELGGELVHAAAAGDHGGRAEEAEDRARGADGGRERAGEGSAPNEPASSEAK